MSGTPGRASAVIVGAVSTKAPPLRRDRNPMRMLPADREPTPPCEMLREEFMKPLGLTQAELTAKLGMPRVAVNAIINGKRSVTPGTAMRLAKALGTTPEFWINGQLAVDLYRAEHDTEQIRAVAKITPIIGAA
jgi:antitoxin HigA-1